MKLRASAMYYALVVSLIMSVVLSLLILISYYYRIQSVQFSLKNKLILNSQSGIAYQMSSSVPIGTTKFDLFGVGNDSLIVTKKPWGLYEQLTSIAFQGTDTFALSAIVGSNSEMYDKTALYLSSTANSLSLAGSTSLIGDLYLPKNGLKKVNIEGKHFTGSIFNENQIGVSSNLLPTLKSTLHTTSPLFLNESNMFQEVELASGEDLYRSFKDKAFVLRTGNLVISNNHLKGNIYIQSTGVVRVSGIAILEDVFIDAETVIIEDNFEGSLQILAKDSVIIGENVHLNYPSAIQLSSNSNGVVKIKQDCKIYGAVLIHRSRESLYDNLLYIGSDATIMGDVYCDGLVEMKGQVFGSLFCEGFYLKTNSGLYSNYLLDAKIDVNRKPAEFISAPMFASSKNKMIVKWLY